MHSLLDAVEELAAVDFLEHKVETLVVLEELDQLNDVVVTLAMVECLDLLENALACVPRDLVDYLDRVLKVCVQGGAGLHRGVSPLS